MISLSIICPSRKGPNQEFFLKRVILSIQTQSIREELQLELIICIDNQEKLDFKISEDFVSVVNSHGNSQASALNAGLALANGDFIAIFEDDDLWDREYLRVYTKVFQNTGIDFLSSNQIELDKNGDQQRIIDFPTPSTWMFRRATGLSDLRFDETFRWHLDNEFLGQINFNRYKRGHLLEKTAPIDTLGAKSSRPDIVKLSTNSFKNVQLIRHNFNAPLVKRQVHNGSGMSQIQNSESLHAESMAEYRRLIEKYGLIPH